MLVTTVTFVKVLLVEAMSASLGGQYTSTRNTEFVNTFCCYDNNNVNFLIAILRHFACKESGVGFFSRAAYTSATNDV